DECKSDEDCGYCEKCINRKCVDFLQSIQTGECCDEWIDCCPLTETCEECIPDPSCETEPDLCVKNEVVCTNCCDCDSDTGECTKDCRTTPEKPECCNNKAYEKFPEGKVRNKETCVCECENPPTCDETKCEQLSADKCSCENKKTTKMYGDCCDKGPVECCPLTESCSCTITGNCGGNYAAGSCGDIYRLDLPEFSEKYKKCETYNNQYQARPGVSGWKSRNIESNSVTGDYSEARIGNSGGTPVYWTAGGTLTTDNPKIGYTATQICGQGDEYIYNSMSKESMIACCPSREYVGCRGEYAVCCPNFAQLPEGATVSCGDGLITDTNYVCCETGGNTAVAIYSSDGKQVVDYQCCAIGEEAVPVYGGKTNEHICCLEGLAAYNNGEVTGPDGSKCCPTGHKVMHASYTPTDGKETTRYECCKEGENAWINTKETTATIECCSADKDVVKDDKTGIQGCCEKGATGYLFKDTYTELQCCKAGKEVKELDEDGVIYRVCCNSGEEPRRIGDNETPGSFTCCAAGSAEYQRAEDLSQGIMSVVKDCCPLDAPYPKDIDIDYNGEEYQMCCPRDDDKTLKVLGGKKDNAGREYEFLCCRFNDETAYYDGNGNECCIGEAFATGVQDSSGRDIYDCCDEQKDEIGVEVKMNAKHVPTTAMVCCGEYTDSSGNTKRKEGYWNGSSLECCSGEVFKKGYSEKGFEGYSYGCCEGATQSPPTHNVYITKLETESGKTMYTELSMCCPKDDPSVYWNGNTVECCKGKTYYTGKTAKYADPNKTDNTLYKVEACCPYDTHKFIEKDDVKQMSGGDELKDMCCDIETYGENPTAYQSWSSGKFALNCCKGKPYYMANANLDTLACCEGATDENPTHVSPEVQGDLEGVSISYPYACCSIEEYTEDATAYFNGAPDSIKCCKGEPYDTGKTVQSNKWGVEIDVWDCCTNGSKMKTGVENDKQLYGCCEGAFGLHPTHKVVPVLGSQYGEEKEEKCCSIEDFGENPTAYWNGVSVECCKGKPIKNGVDADGKQMYACCEGATENPTHAVSEVKGAPHALELCCDMGRFGDEPTAYWNGSSAQCCKGVVYQKDTDSSGNPVYACCDGTPHYVSYEESFENGETIETITHNEWICCKKGTSPTTFTGEEGDTWVECCASSGCEVYNCEPKWGEDLENPEHCQTTGSCDNYMCCPASHPYYARINCEFYPHGGPAHYNGECFEKEVKGCMTLEEACDAGSSWACEVLEG
ncbi:MAG: hypothetical protein IJC30_02825, partial [Alphaproteobacteria bacterium]|nr:hypothetical protein [Alphaproteobacteria bacterium]